jgi:hypothetical protein
VVCVTRPVARLLPIAAPLLPVLLLVAHALRYSAYTDPHAATVVSYARTLLAGGGLALQPGAIQSYGFSSPLWLLVVSGLSALGLDELVAARIVGLALAALALYLLPWITARLAGIHRPVLLGLLPPLLLALNPDVARHAVDGLEGPLVLLLLALALLLFVAEERRFAGSRRPPGDLWSALPLGLLLLASPEGPVLAGALLLARVLARGMARRLPLTSLIWLLLLPLLYGLWLLLCYWQFAELWPGVVTAGQARPVTTLGDPQAVAAGWAALQRLLDRWGFTAVLLSVAALGALRARNYWGRMALLLLTALTLAALVASGGAPGGRVLLPLLLGPALLLAEGLGSLVRRLWPPGSRLALVAGLALTVGLLAAPAAAGLRAVRRPPANPLADSMSLVASLEQTVRQLGWRPQQVRLLTTSPGVAALAGFRVVDASGVTDPAIRRHHGNRHPSELQQLIFRERQPDILVERGPWLRVHAFTAFPEARRLFERLHLARRGLRVAISRSLFLEPEPWPDLRLRHSLGRRLWLLGARAEPGQLILLWMVDGRVHRPRRVRLRLGGPGGPPLTVQVGPGLYPIQRWRTGEIVRQRVPVDPERLPAVDSLELQLGGGWVKLGPLDGDFLRGTVRDYYHRRLMPLLQEADWEMVELLPALTRDPAALMDMSLDRVLDRVDQLIAQGRLMRAARQLRQVTLAPQQAPRPRARQQARRVARRAYRRAEVQMRSSRWPLAFDSLQAAAMTAPTDPWVTRLLEQTRRRRPAENHIMQLLELELARRALALAPSAGRLARVMSAHLDLGHYQRAVAAAVTWRAEVEHTRRVRYLTARALNRQGDLVRARRITDALIRTAPDTPLRRRCPRGLLLPILYLDEQLRDLQGAPPRPGNPDAHFVGQGHMLELGTRVVAHCAWWKPGHRLHVELFFWQPEPVGLPLTVVVGSRRQREVLGPTLRRLRRLSLSLHLPPASYPIRLEAPGASPLPLGTVVVGPESTFGFELPTYVSWRNRGQAFGKGPVVGRSFRVRRLFGYVGERFADSWSTGSDRLTGQLTSPRFRLRRSHLMLLVAGGDSPRLGVDLVVEGRKVATVHGHRTEVLQPAFIPIAHLRGRWAQVVIRDGDTAPWGHIAVDEIRQLDGPAQGLRP